METLAKKIHNKVYASAESFCEVVTQDEQKQDFETTQSLRRLGFGSFQGAREMEKYQISTIKRSEASDFAKWFNKLLLNPDYKIITYGNLMNVLGKYDLYLGNSDQYLKEIPEFAAKKILQHSSLLRSNGWNKNLFFGHYTSSPSYFVCAGFTDFHKPVCTIGRELCYDEECKKQPFKLMFPHLDPIIVSPLVYRHKIVALDIVTAWDRESLDPEVVNEIQN